MKFLICKGGRIILDYGFIHSLTTEQIIELRNQLSALRKLRAIRSELDMFLEFKNKDFQTVWMNEGLESDFMESLNSMIIKRKTKGDKKK